ncbi:MAG: T9SS type A sorting domain-containing protein [Flavobacteriia bacterium]|nr:T9SS type A sorting domain-containing protein [Flavobacteriia bacterium]
MKKITLSLLGLAFGATSFAQTDQNQLPAQLTKMDPEAVVRRTPQLSPSNGPEAIIWSEDFSNGIPATWSNQGFDGNMQPLTAAQWEYRGPNTTPNNGTGSRGAFANANDPIQSPTRGNGFVIFDSGFLDNAGNAQTAGQGAAPAPHVGTLTTDTIDLTNNSLVMLEFSNYARVFFANFQVVFSADGGQTWNDTILVYSDGTLGINMASANADRVQYNVSQYIGGSANAMMRFIFDGRPGNANGNGYYFWCLDDIQLLDLPDHVLQFVTNTDGAPPHDMIFDNDGSNSKYGIMTLKQARPISFDGNILNFGGMTQTNVRLEIDILDGNNNNVQSLSSTSVTLPSDSIADYTVMNTVSWTPQTTGTYRVIYSALSDSVNGVDYDAPRDTFTIYVTDSLWSLDFNVFDNRFGTDDIGADNSALAVRHELMNDERLFGVDIWLSATTVAGGLVEVTVYDTTGFSFTNGFPTNALAYSQHTVTGQDVASRMMRVPLSDANGNPIYLDASNTGAYYIVVTLFSNADANPINIRNSQTFEEPPASAIMYYTISNPRWYTGFTGSLDLNAPHIRAITCPASNAAACMSISIDEIDLANDIQLYPNPANEFVNIEFGDVNGEMGVRVVDVQGRTVLESNEMAVEGTVLPYDLSTLKPGIYILTLSHENSVSSFRLTVE